MFNEMIARLWAAIFDLLLRMSNLFRDRRAGIIFLVVNYNHIAATLRTADTAASGRGRESAQGERSGVSSGAGGSGREGGGASLSSSGGAASGAGAQLSAPKSGIGKAGLSAIKECEVRCVPS